MKIPNLMNLRNGIDCLSDPLNKQVLEGYFNEFKKETGATNARLTINTPTIGASVTIASDGPDVYDWLMGSKHTVISNNISAVYYKTVVFPSFDLELKITYVVYCDIPDDDFETLDSLGKVHREWVEGHNEQSVYCEI